MGHTITQLVMVVNWKVVTFRFIPARSAYERPEPYSHGQGASYSSGQQGWLRASRGVHVGIRDTIPPKPWNMNRNISGRTRKWFDSKCPAGADPCLSGRITRSGSGIGWWWHGTGGGWERVTARETLTGSRMFPKGRREQWAWGGFALLQSHHRGADVPWRGGPRRRVAGPFV